MEKLTVLIVEDDDDVCESFVRHANNMDDIQIINITNNATTALDNIKSLHPDVMILDLELHLGSGSGIDVLEGMRSLSLTKTPYILITTNNLSRITHNCVRQLGADFIMTKYQANYSEAHVLSMLHTIKPFLQSSELSEIAPSANRQETIKHRIATELNLVSIRPRAVGYKYLADAIFLLATNTPDIYSVLCAKYRKSEASIRRSMQYEIDRAWTHADLDNLFNNYAGPISLDRLSPTVTELIHYYAEKVK